MLTTPRTILFFFAKLLTIALSIGVLLPQTLAAQATTRKDTLQTSYGIGDTLRITKNVPSNDLQKTDSLTTDSTAKKKSASSLSAEVTYKADDSITFNLKDKRVFMYGNSQVNYQTTELKSAFISYGFENNIVRAEPRNDTSGKAIGKPVFSDNGQSYESDTLSYNFKTKKGAIKGVYTKLNNDGHIFGEQVRKDSNDVLWIKNGEFCPCEDRNAKTRISVNKIKVIPNSKIVTGPGYLKVGKIPTPLVFPFGFFPNQQKRSSGILIPLFQQSPVQGFSLVGLGYYQPISDHIDFQFAADLYSKGSFSMHGITKYKTNYKNNGGISIDYNAQKNSYKGFDDYSDNRTFFVRWNHTMDPKARPNTSFNANVNVGSSNSFRTTINTNVNDYLSNTFTSGVNYGKSWNGKPYNLSISANHSQNTQSKVFTLGLPNAAFNVSRIYLPLGFLKNKNKASIQWYEKIGLNYSASLVNTLQTTESELQFSNYKKLAGEFNNGITHNASLSTSFKVSKFTINPAINATERWYSSTIEKFHNERTGTYGTLKNYGFDRAADYSAALNFTTQLYGMYTFRKGKIAAIRHILTPSAALNYRPGFDHKIVGPYGENGTEITYSPYDGSIIGAPNGVQSGGMSFGLSNNLEMKVRTPNDTVSTTKKVKLIEGFSLTSAYDIFRDSVNWNPININAFTTIYKNVSINYNAIFSPYAKNETGQFTNQSLFQAEGKLLKMQNTNIALNASFGSITSQTPSTTEKGKRTIKDILPVGNPLSITLSYSLNLQNQFSTFSQLDSLITTQSLSASGSIQLLRKLKLNYQSGWDFLNKKLTPTQLNLYWDLNCWELAIDYVPFGFRKSYGIRLNMKSALLKDLKLERKRNIGSPNLLY